MGISAAKRADRLDWAIALLIQAEDILEELGMQAELDRLVAAVDPVVFERDYIVITDLSEPTFTTPIAGIYQPKTQGAKP